jgi:hypothetical protein
VITGTVLDVDGAPVQGISVLAMERRFSGTGAYRYVPARAAALPTDDRGVYRIYGLPAGDYVVAAQPGRLNAPGAPGTNAAIHPMTHGAPGDRSFTITQVYYPSSVDPAQATRLTMRAGEERSGIDVQLQYVPLATISGAVAFAPGGMAPMVAAYPVSSELWPVWVRSGRADAAGAFTLGPLPPGQYQVVARRLDAAHHFSVAAAEVTLDGNDVGNLALSPQAAPAVTGLLVFRGDASPPAFGTEWSDPTTLYYAMDYSPPMQVDGVRFTIQGAVPGRYFLGGNIMGVRKARSGWWLQSLTAGGVELLDAPVDLRQTVDNAVAVFTDRASVLSGLVVDAGGNRVPDATVVAFSLDRSTWFYQSRRVAGVKPDASGRYVIRNLPPGEYRVVAVMDLDVNEWFDPAVLERLLGLSLRLTIAGTAPQTLDLTIR